MKENVIWGAALCHCQNFIWLPKGDKIWQIFAFIAEYSNNKVLVDLVIPSISMMSLGWLKAWNVFLTILLFPCQWESQCRTWWAAKQSVFCLFTAPAAWCGLFLFCGGKSTPALLWPDVNCKLPCTNEERIFWCDSQFPWFSVLLLKNRTHVSHFGDTVNLLQELRQWELLCKRSWFSFFSAQISPLTVNFLFPS